MICNVHVLHKISFSSKFGFRLATSFSCSFITLVSERSQSTSSVLSLVKPVPATRQSRHIFPPFFAGLAANNSPGNPY